MKIIKYIIIIIFLFQSKIFAEENFNLWLDNFSNLALKKGISQKTINDVLKNAKFLPNVIKYDRYQPEFYEDTKTYINKRANKRKLKKGSNLYNKNKKKNR